MKTNLFLRGLKATAVFFLVVVLAASCRENNPELEFTPEEKETQMSSVSDVLYQFTLQYDDENAAGLDDAIEKVRKNEFVKEVVKESDHIKVTYTNGLEIYYPFIMPSAFEGGADDALEAMVDSPLLTRADPYGGYYRGKCKIFNFFSDDPKRAGQTRILEKVARRARFSLRLVSESGPSEDETDMIYGKDKVTIENIEAAIRDSENEVVIIATHGFQNQVVTSEYIQAKSLAGLSQKDLRDFMAQERLVACGEKDAYGNPVYNKAWYVQNYSGRWNADFVYFTGCSIFSPSVCKALNNNPFAYSLIAGWDGKNNIGEALLMALFDSFINGMSFKEFYAKEGSHTDRSYDSNLVFAGKRTDYKPGDETYAVTERTSRLKYPRNFCEKSYLRTNTVQMILEDRLNKEGYFYCDVHDVLNGEKKKRSEFHYQALYDLFDQLLTASDCSVTYWLGQPGVYRVSLHYVFTKNGVEQNILIDEKYILQCNGFGVNGAEETIPTIKVASVVTESADLLYGCQTTVCPEDLTQQGFKVWEKDNPSQMMEIQGTPHENNIQVFQAHLNGLKAGTTYQAQAYVKYITGDEFAGNVVEFTASDGSSTAPTEPTPGDLIDLGLSVKWASCNIGATEPQDIGGFYAWGETQTKSSYSWSNYGWCRGSETTLTKYCTQSSYGTVDNKTVLDSADDVAYSTSGGKLRMPTSSEWQELIDRCQWTKIQYKDRDGYLVASPVTGNAIFIPCNGFKTQSNYYNFYAPYYWSSELSATSPGDATKMAYLVSCEINGHQRFEGLGVRPVANTNVNDEPETEIITVNGVSFKMVKVEGGSFMTKSNYWDSPRNVTLNDYMIGETEVTQELWEAVMGSNQSSFSGSNRPVETVSWNDCKAFLQRLNALTGKEFLLPTIEQWEYAAVGGSKTHGYQYSGNNDANEVAWYSDNSSNETHPIARKKCNELGLYDMSGNVWELTEEISQYSGPVACGGCAFSKEEEVSISSYVCVGSEDDSYDGIGLRLVISNEQNNNSVVIPEAIDLGLSVKWASFNLGASKPEESGDYYAWGETEPKTKYTWETYKWCNGSEYSLTKYCSENAYGLVDNKTVLDPGDDAAHVEIGGEWRMPTREEQLELWNNCSFEEITQGGITGFRITGPNGNSIFMPGTGYMTAQYWSGTALFLWSSTLRRSDTAFCLPYFEGDGGYFSDSRCTGYTIRPVYGTSKATSEVKTPEIVDMGLSVKWASFNLGATKPEEFGNYYAWGETESDFIYKWSTYTWCNGSSTSLTKYCSDVSYGYNGFTDEKAQLDPEDDAAHVELGGKWRMPTAEEWSELLNSSSSTWTTINGIFGRRFTSSITGNSIFLPAAGYRYENHLGDARRVGYYSLSSLSVEYPLRAWFTYFNTTEVYTGGYSRYYGLSIRPVYEE